MDSPLLVVVILVSYLLFVLKIGPNYMKDRKPYKLRKVILLYNAGQVLISCYLVYLCLTTMWTHGFMPKACIIKTEQIRKKTTTAIYYYLLAKISELLDTIFFVLRKKMNQVTFLHVYHHTLMVVVTWIALKYEPTYTLFFIGVVNSFVHVAMYSYYGLSSFPSMTKYLWWKKYITIIQLIQFVMITVHFGASSVRSECSPSITMTIALVFNTSLFLYLFGSFYVDNYNKKNGIDTTKSNDLKRDNRFQNNFNSSDTKVIQNSDKFNSCHRNDTDFKGASTTFDERHRIKINLEANKTPA